MYGIIYKTTNLANGKIYIGQHVCESDEFDGYLGSGRNLILAVRHYGPENFKRETLRICDTQPQLDAWEMLYIKKLHSTEKDIGYNILPGSSNMFGQVNPAKIPEVKCKMSIAAKRRLSSPAAREAIRIRMTGIKQSEESKAKKSQSLIGRIITAEHREKISKALRGKKKTQEHINKVAEALRGKHHTEEWKRRHSEIMSGRVRGAMSDDTKRKISEANKKYYSKHKNVVSERMKKYYSTHPHPLTGTKFVWINNGLKNKRLPKGVPVPDGWFKGMIRTNVIIL